MTKPALFLAFPGLEGGIPHRPFLDGSTPVGPLGAAGLPPDVHIKHDEHCTPLYGGNKPRKLEFVIGAALARGARRLVTTGGLGTHHGLATAILGRAAGFGTTLVLVDQPLTPEVRESLRLFAAWEAEVVDGRNVAGAALRGSWAFARSALRGERPFLVPTGGSSAAGVLGAVSAGLELAEQVRAGALPEPVSAYVAVGSGGSLAGLVLGLRLGRLATRATGVLVTDILPPSRERLARLARGGLRLLRRADPTVPDVAITRDDFHLVTRQLGPGYGVPTPAGERAQKVAGEAGVRLEPTYTAKCFAELLARADEGALGTPSLFWNTYNAIDPWASAPGPADPERLPQRLRELAFA
jgi:D-cysteine desulfhydrase